MALTFDHVLSHDSFEKPSAIQQRAIIPCIQGSISFLAHANYTLKPPQGEMS